MSHNLDITFYTNYLMLNRAVTLPGIGRFELHRVPARNDLDRSEILPPFFTIRFDPYKVEVADSQSQYMMRRQNLTADALINNSNLLTSFIQEKLSKDNLFDWPGVGSLTQSEAGILFFEGRNIQSEFYKIQPYKKLTRHEIASSISAPENLSSDELLEPFADSITNKWRVPAIMLLSIVLLLIVARLMYGSFSILGPRYDPIKVTTPSITYKRFN
jgi:hypothetical protein